MGVGLQGRDKSIGAQGDSAQTCPCPAAVLAHPLPDKPGTTDFQDRGRGEQKNRLCDEHLVSLVAGARKGVYTDSRICSYRAKEVVDGLRVDDGKITLWKDYWDMAALTDSAPPSWMENLMSADMSWIYDATG